MAETTKVTKIEHKNIYQARSAFQGEMKPMPKNATVEFEANNGSKVKYNYTPLGDEVEIISPILARHGLSFGHEIVKDNGKDFVVCILTHESYEEVQIQKTTTKQFEGVTETIIETEWHIKNQIKSGPVQIPSGGQMKDLGGAITYAKRYSLNMVLGLASEDDKDAELLGESQKNAVKFAYGKAKDGVDNAKDSKALEKMLKTLQSDLKDLENGKAPALGLTKDQYTELIEKANKRMVELTKTESTKQ